MSAQRIRRSNSGLRAPSRAVFTRVSVRDARADDAAIIAEMANALAVITTGEQGRATADAVRRDLIGDDALRCLVAERSGRVAGYALFSAAYESAVAARGVYLSDLFTLPGQRREGVAIELMRELARRCEADGGRFIWWAVTPGNAEAKAFYDSLGAISDPVDARAIFEAPFRALLEG